MPHNESENGKVVFLFIFLGSDKDWEKQRPSPTQQHSTAILVHNTANIGCYRRRRSTPTNAPHLKFIGRGGPFVYALNALCIWVVRFLSTIHFPNERCTHHERRTGPPHHTLSCIIEKFIFVESLLWLITTRARTCVCNASVCFVGVLTWWGSGCGWRDDSGVVVNQQTIRSGIELNRDGNCAVR